MVAEAKGALDVSALIAQGREKIAQTLDLIKALSEDGAMNSEDAVVTIFGKATLCGTKVKLLADDLEDAGSDGDGNEAAALGSELRGMLKQLNELSAGLVGNDFTKGKDFVRQLWVDGEPPLCPTLALANSDPGAPWFPRLKCLRFLVASRV